MFKTLKRNFLPFIIAFSALSVSASAAFYSVSGLSKLFAGASFEVMVMAGSLEVAKLVVASLLYQYWDTINKGLRAYLSIATIILVLITSMGIYGFLSAAYQETYSKLLIQENEIEFIENKAQFYEADLVRYDTELARISENINILSSAKASGIQVRDTTSSTGFRQTISTTELRMAQKRIEVEEANRKDVQVKRQVAADSVQVFKLEILSLQNTSETAGELGPLQYLSGLTGTPMDKIINWLLLVIIFVFDPLAISLVVAANFAFDQARIEEDEDTEYTPRDSIWDDMEDMNDLPDIEDNLPDEREDLDYVEDILNNTQPNDTPLDLASNKSGITLDTTIDKKNADAWGALADELAKGLVEGENDQWMNDPDIQDFLEQADEPGPYSEEDDKIHTVGGLTNDKEGSFMKFQDQLAEKDQPEYDAYVDRQEPGSWLKNTPEEKPFDAIIDDAEFDEDHELDLVLNDMVKDFTPADIETIVEANENPPAPNQKLKEAADNYLENNPTSVGAIVQKIETPHLPNDTTTTQAPITTTTTTQAPTTTTKAPDKVNYMSEDELLKAALRERAEEAKQEFLKNNDKQN